MSNNLQENHHLGNSRLAANRRVDPPEIEQFTNFTPWEVDENLEYSPSHYPIKVEEKKKQSRPQTSKALYFPDGIPGIESYTKNTTSPRSSRNLIQKAPGNKIRVPENIKNKKRSITSASNANIKSSGGVPLNMHKFPVSKKALNPQKNEEAQSMNLDTSSTIDDQEQQESKDQVSVSITNNSNNRPVSREGFQNNSKDQSQISPGKLHRHLQNVFEKDRELTGQSSNGARGYAVKPKVLNLSTKGVEIKYDTDNSDNFRETMSSFRERAYEHMKEESVESETNKENMTGLELKSESFFETTEKFRPLNGVPRRSQSGFKSVDITNQKIRHVKTVKEEALTSENTPRGYQIQSRKIGVGGAPRTPLSNTMLTSQNIKLEQKLLPFNKNRTLRAGSQAKQRADVSEEQRKNSILGLEIKSTEYVNAQAVATRARAPIPGFLQNNMSQNQERSITINNYIPSMLDCYKKNKRKYLVSPSKLAPQLKDAFHNYYDTNAHTPLVRTLRRINGKCQYDKHILNYFNDMNEPASTDTDEKVLNHFLNKSYKPKINLPSRKTNPSSQHDKSDLIDRFINQTMSNMSGGNKIKMNEARSFMTEKSPERMVSWTGQRKLKPAVEIQNFIIRK